MKKLLSLYFEVLLCVLYTFNCGVYGQVSPCPNVFEYKYDGFNSYGIASVPAVPGSNNLKVKYAVETLSDESNTGQITPIDSNSEVIQKLQSGGKIRYKVEFPNGISSIPEILSIKLNEQEYCKQTQGATFSTILTVSLNLGLSSPGSPSSPSPEDPPMFVPPPEPKPKPKPKPRPPPDRGSTLFFGSPSVLPPSNVHTISPNLRPSSSSSLFNRIQDDWLRTYKYDNVCGRKDAVAIHTVINGRDVVPNEFPWLVALFDNKRSYFCGGSLVSDKHVITAAHCTESKTWVYAELGKHILDNVNEAGVALRVSETIVSHPEYTPKTGHADISIIALSERVSFTTKIKPICLWPFESHYVGVVGIVAGWGTDISGDGTNTPMAANVDIVSDDDCRNSHQLFTEITSHTTFCAGGKNRGPCTGDSGSGFIVEESNRWYLKGIISTSLRKGFSSCDVLKYAVYCDVGKYLDWIKTNLL